jgi:hypothetical protein
VIDLDSSELVFVDLDGDWLNALLGPGVGTDYLTNYLQDLGATSAILEPHYIDRHYLDEFSAYYARCFSVPSPHCQRAHFFLDASSSQLRELFEAATLGEQSSANEIQERYLGFLVRRPLEAAPIGRTVLKTYPHDGRRHYEASRPYRVHLANLELRVDGLAFQNQDGGAAVCASTALWSALQQVAFASGNRTPTPQAITAAARSPFPAANGLGEESMATALSTLGYSAELLAPSDNRPLFRALICASLESHLPVVLLISRLAKTGAGQVSIAHAVTLTGFSFPPSIVEVPSRYPDVNPWKMRSGSLDIVYTHDDNLGPHAHYELIDSDDVDELGNKKLQLIRGNRINPRPATWPVDTWDVFGALIPKPVKLRYSLPSLVNSIAAVRPIAEMAFVSTDLHYRVCYRRGIEVKSLLASPEIALEDRLTVLFKCSLPRHVGVIFVLSGEDTLCEFIIDVLDEERDSPRALLIIARDVGQDSPEGLVLASLAAEVGVPIVLNRDEKLAGSSV